MAEIKVVATACKLMQLVAAESLSVNELARRLGITPTKASRIVEALAADGFVERDNELVTFGRRFAEAYSAYKRRLQAEAQERTDLLSRLS